MGHARLHAEGGVGGGDQGVDLIGPRLGAVPALDEVAGLLEVRGVAEAFGGHLDTAHLAVQDGAVDADLGAVEELLDEDAVAVRQGGVPGAARQLEGGGDRLRLLDADHADAAGEGAGFDDDGEAQAGGDLLGLPGGVGEAVADGGQPRLVQQAAGEVLVPAALGGAGAHVVQAEPARRLRGDLQDGLVPGEHRGAVVGQLLQGAGDGVRVGEVGGAPVLEVGLLPGGVRRQQGREPVPSGQGPEGVVAVGLSATSDQDDVGLLHGVPLQGSGRCQGGRVRLRARAAAQRLGEPGDLVEHPAGGLGHALGALEGAVLGDVGADEVDRDGLGHRHHLQRGDDLLGHLRGPEAAEVLP